MSKQTIFTLGYQRWKPQVRITEMVKVLKANGVRYLVDIRHSPCASNPTTGGMYGPTDVNLQLEGHGLVARLQAAGIEYRWLVELGNPQKNDPEMKILREHLAQDGEWPVQRGLAILEGLIRSNDGEIVLLCACKKYRECHRSLIAEALSLRLPELTIKDLSS